MSAVKRFAAAWVVFWLGVVVGIALWALVDFKAGLLAFALGLLLTIVLVVLGIRRGVSAGKQVFNELAEEGRRRSPGTARPSFDRRVTTTVDDLTPTEDVPVRDPRFPGGPTTDYDGPEGWHPRRF